MTSYLPRPTGTAVAFIKKPKPFAPSLADVLLADLAEYELRPRRVLAECLPRVRMADCLKPRRA